jgi:hypothetical protein
MLSKSPVKTWKARSIGASTTIEACTDVVAAAWVLIKISFAGFSTTALYVASVEFQNRSSSARSSARPSGSTW